MLGTTEILIIAGVIILLFGASALPKLARAIAKVKSEFHKGLKETAEEETEEERNNPPS